MTATPGEVILLLAQLRDGDEAASEALFALTNGQLRDVAGAILRGEQPGNTLKLFLSLPRPGG